MENNPGLNIASMDPKDLCDLCGTPQLNLFANRIIIDVTISLIELSKRCRFCNSFEQFKAASSHTFLLLLILTSLFVFFPFVIIFVTLMNLVVFFVASCKLNARFIIPSFVSFLAVDGTCTASQF